MRTSLVLLLALLLLSVRPTGLSAQATYQDRFCLQYRCTTGLSIGRSISRIAGALQQTSQAIADVERRLVSARRAYWNAYPDGPGLEDASFTLYATLWEKDFNLLVPRVVDPSGGTLALVWLVNGSEIDGGVPERAADEFARVVSEVRSYLQANPFDLVGLFSSPLVALAYDRYTQARDLTEFYKGPYSPLRTTDAPLDLLTASFTYWEVGSPDDARRIFERLANLLEESQQSDLHESWRRWSGRDAPPKPHEALRDGLRAVMNAADDTRRYREAAILLEGLESDVFTPATLEEALIARHSEQVVSAYTQDLMERERAGLVTCGDGFSCFVSVAQGVSPESVLGDIDASLTQWRIESNRAWLREQGVTGLQLETEAYEYTWEDWQRELMRHSRHFSELVRDGLALHPAVVGLDQPQSPAQVWAVIWTLAEIRRGCLVLPWSDAPAPRTAQDRISVLLTPSSERERDPPDQETRDLLCIVADEATAHFFDTVGLFQWADAPSVDPRLSDTFRRALNYFEEAQGPSQAGVRRLVAPFLTRSADRLEEVCIPTWTGARQNDPCRDAVVRDTRGNIRANYIDRARALTAPYLDSDGRKEP